MLNGTVRIPGDLCLYDQKHRKKLHLHDQMSGWLRYWGLSD